MKKHFTATAYVVSKIDGEYKVLLHKHKKHNIWIGIGGHIEKDENPTEAVIREVKEETNLEIKLLGDGKLLKTTGVEELINPFAILQEKIPGLKDDPSHYHIDLIYFATCLNPKKIQMSEEYNWFSKKALKQAKLGKEVTYLAQKLFKALKNV